VVLHAVLALAPHASPTVPAALRTAWQHPERPTRYPLGHAIVTSLADIRTPEATAIVIELLPHLEAQLRYEAVARLTRTTGKPFGGDVAAWSEWWQAAEGRLPQLTEPASEALPRDLKWPQPLPKFCGIPIYAKRVVFVVEHSQGVMGTVGGKPRLETVQDELSAAIKRLPEDVSFNLVAFNDRVERWQPSLVVADSANKAAAIQAAYRLSGTGRAAMFDAIESAFTLEDNIEQVLLVSTGKPTAGKIVDRRVIVEPVVALNQHRRIRLDTFGVAANAQGEETLKRLATRSFGDYLKFP